MINITRIIEDYKPDDDIFTEESEDMNKLKHIIYDKLSEIDRRVILLYADLQSIRKVAAHLGVSASTAYILITRIKNDIKKFL